MFTITSVVAADQNRPRVTGFFSDMHFVQEAGDVIGIEVWIAFARGSYWATVQLAEGEPEVPIVVKALVNGDHIEFHLNEPNEDFKGRVVGDRLVGNLGAERISLPRRRSYWQ